MARVTGDHWSAARLRHIANKKSRPVIKAACVVGEAFKKVQQPRMTPIAVARLLCWDPLPVGEMHLRRIRLCGTLQSSAHALGITEGCALASSAPTSWRHCRHSDPGWTK